jgi:23S rRNA pseudouridine1911/1915/1917 synthase
MAINQTEKAKPFLITVSEKDRGKRFDQFLAEAGLSLSRSQAKRLIDTKTILLDGKPVKPSHHVKPGERVDGIIPEAQPLSSAPEALPLSILFEDSALLVVDKPAGMVVHPAAGNPSGTLVNALLHHCRDLSGINGVLRPGIVHRLDKDTSGVMVVAKGDLAYHHLSRQFKNRVIEKGYLAICHGRFEKDQGTIEAAIGRHPGERKRMSTHTRKGREATTEWKVAERLESVTFLEVQPRTGRTHQIRVHLSSIGHPILGDPLYGRKAKPGCIQDPLVRACAKRIGRQALHAHRLAFIHPITGQKVGFAAPLPEDMADVLNCLRERKAASIDKKR